MYVYVNHYRRKFRSQTSDNMDKWKSRGGKSQRGEEPKREDQRRVIVRRKLTGWAFLDVQMWFCVAGARDSTPCQKRAKREGLVAVPKTMAGLGHLQRICKDAFRVAGAVQETCSSEMLGGQDADFLRGVSFWSIRSVGLLRWFCVTSAALRMAWH